MDCSSQLDCLLLLSPVTPLLVEFLFPLGVRLPCCKTSRMLFRCGDWRDAVF